MNRSCGPLLVLASILTAQPALAHGGEVIVLVLWQWPLLLVLALVCTALSWRWLPTTTAPVTILATLVVAGLGALGAVELRWHQHVAVLALPWVVGVPLAGALLGARRLRELLALAAVLLAVALAAFTVAFLL